VIGRAFLDVGLPDGSTRNLVLPDGLVAEWRDPALAIPDDVDVVAADGEKGWTAVPAPVDAHLHPDKTTWGQPWLSRRPASDLQGLIDNDVRAQQSFTASVADRATALMRSAATQGTRAIRAHVDVAPVHGLRNLHGVVEAAGRLAGLVDVQVVAFPQLGLLREPGTADLMDAALQEGASIVGGIDPLGVDGDVNGHLDVVFGLAARRGREVDLHLHDDGEPGLAQLLAIAERTRALGMGGRVTVSHAFALATAPAARRAAVAEQLAGAGVALTTCALGGDPVLPVSELRRLGVRVAAGSDGVRDAWTPFGTGSMIDRAHLLAYRLDAATDDSLAECWTVCSTEGAALLGLDTSALGGAEPADFVVAAANSVAELVVDRPPPTAVVRAGRLLL
jgi:cytosine/creatinine deaminase